ncbi:hypothetical protein MNBD_GAMMA24-2531 [hydrothermal vent metagenome]|uniref:TETRATRICOPEPTIDE REPEAT FAMILY PROTEIN n=1 Tax=hydrothermal vent metagenome TaxID=652676 RepID=A0A3B1B749_9ZZZZ
MRLRLIRVLVLPIFLFCYAFSISANAEEFNQFKLDMILAKRGDPVAQFYVAGDYEEGRGIHKDLLKAFEWYKTAANKKHNGAQFKLGEFYENGWGVKADKEKALFWYKKAEQNGSRRAKKYLNKLELGKQVEASNRAKKELDRKRRLAAEKAKKEKQRHLAAERGKRERQARQTRARERTRHKKVLIAKSSPAASLSVSSRRKKLSAQDKTAAITNYMQVLLNNKWHSKTAVAELLPSALNNCLKSSDKELVCFSHEQRAVIGDSEITFTSKSVINSFKHNGDFRVRYYFNVLDVHAASTPAKPVDGFGLREQKGWQEPEQSMQCHINNRKKLKCVHGGHDFYFQS